MIDAYVVAGYALIWAVLLAYAWHTRRRLRDAERRLAAARRESGREGRKDPENDDRMGAEQL